MENRINQDDIVTVKIEKDPQIHLAAESVQGTREYQQDAYFTMETNVGSLAIICDGMGGMEHGEIASRKAVEKMAGDFENWTGDEEVPIFLQQEAEEMDRLVANLTDINGQIMDAGTTVVATIVVGNKLYWLAVGDSRIYILRGNEMLCVTRDHNYGYRLGRRLENGEISEEKYKEEEKNAEALISYLGMNGLEMLDVNRVPFELEYGDRVLLCSDGLYKCVTAGKLEELLLYQNYGVENAVRTLMEEVEKSPKRNKDNTTVIMLAYE